MKYLFFSLLLITSCDSMISSATEDVKTNETVKQQDGFQKLMSKNGTYNLFYKIEKDRNSPVQMFSYYVAATKTERVIRTTEKIAAEKIYWKDDHTVAIVPYVGMVQQDNDLDTPKKPKEILINIK